MYEMFFSIIRNRISCFQKKMVQYPVEWNFTSNETEPAAEWRFIHMPKVRTKDLIEQFQLELMNVVKKEFIVRLIQVIYHDLVLKWQDFYILSS
ncbi:hypothetical protein ACT7DH_20790 [Bacillus pacificus]